MMLLDFYKVVSENAYVRLYTNGKEIYTGFLDDIPAEMLNFNIFRIAVDYQSFKIIIK